MDAQTSPARNTHLNIQTVHGVIFPAEQLSVLSGRRNTAVTGRPSGECDSSSGSDDSENDTSARQSARSSDEKPELR
jgi:hypothetical protein